MSHRRPGLVARAVIMLMVAVFALAACTPVKPGQQTVGGTADLTPVKGGRAVTGAISDAKVLNPILASDVPSAEVYNRVYESLIRVNPRSGQPGPGLAQSFEVAPDGTALTFVL